MSRRAAILNWSLALAGLSLALPTFVFAEEFVGEVTGTSDNVHVRSGPSTNFYPVVRLAPGQRVKVVGEESGWYAIEPLPGCFSLISKHYVDIGANGEGVVNGTAVRVRAGSEIDEHRYAVQTKLDKGAVVKVLGEEEEGFLKIAPPPGTRIWIHSDYVARVPADRLANEQPAAPQVTAAAPANAPVAAAPAAVPMGEDVADSSAEVMEELVAPGAATQVATEPAALNGNPAGNTGETAAAPAPAVDAPALTPETLGKLSETTRERRTVAATEPKASKPAGKASEGAALGSIERLPVEEGGIVDAKLRKQLADMDEQFSTEMSKPVEERQLAALVTGYDELAKQEADKFVKLYAERRLAQVELAVATTDAIRDIRSLSDDVARQRRESLEDRSKLRPPPVRLVMRGFDAKGELRESMIFASRVGPQRYRLVDPGAEVPRTLCYVEIAEGLNINIQQFLGQTVGIRARKQYLETDNVDPIPVVVAEEIVILDEPAAEPAAKAAADGADDLPADVRVLVSDVDTRE